MLIKKLSAKFDKLNAKKVCVKLFPKILTPDQKLVDQQIYSDFLELLDEEPESMEHIINCNETWIFEYDVETKRQSMHWKISASLRMKKARMLKSKFKAMLIVFFNIDGIVMTEWVPEGQTYYLKVLATL